MKTMAMIVVIMVVSMMPCLADSMTQLEKQQNIYRQNETVVVTEQVSPVVKNVEKCGDAMLTPIRVLKETTNQIVNPQLEFLYDESSDDLKYGCNGPKFRMQF